MKKLIKVLASVLALSITLAVGCTGKKDEITVYMPDGAPAMALANLMNEGMDGVDFQVVNPSVIATKVSNEKESKNADICALPITAASKLLGSGENYQMLSILTSGNLYLLSKDEMLVSSFENSGYKDISYLLGKTVGVMKINDVPGLTFKWSIENYNLDWQELTNDGIAAADKVNLKGIGAATDIMPNDASVTAYLVAEPAASIQMQKNGFRSVCSLETLYYKGEKNVTGYPQAVLVAKRSLIENRPAFIEDFLEKVESSCGAVYSLTGEQIVKSVRKNLEDKNYATTLNASVLTKNTVARCGVKFIKISDAKDVIMRYLYNIRSIDDKIQTVNEEFFYFG